MDKSERIADHEKRGVLTEHRDRMANDPEYREAALTAPSITEKRGIHEKVLERTTPTALSGSPTTDASDNAFDVETATKQELVDYADEHDIEVTKSAKVDDIRDQVRSAD